MQQSFQIRLQRHHGQLGADSCDVLHDLPTQRHAHVTLQHRRVLRARRLFGQGLDDRAHVADRHALGEQALQDAHQRPPAAARCGTRSSTSFGARLRQRVEQLLHFLVAEDLVGVRLDDVTQMGRDDGARIDHRVAQRLGVIARRRARSTRASMPNAGSRVAMPLTGPNTRPGLMASSRSG